jgi:hypothetical protein
MFQCFHLLVSNKAHDSEQMYVLPCVIMFCLVNLWLMMLFCFAVTNCYVHDHVLVMSDVVRMNYSPISEWFKVG